MSESRAMNAPISAAVTGAAAGVAGVVAVCSVSSIQER
jgi:hypothetical protein